VLQGLPGIQMVFKGAPASIGNKVAAYVGLGPQILTLRTAGGSVRREASYFVGFAYRVEGAPDAAEATVCTLLDAFLRVIYADLTLGGTVKAAELDLALSRQPQYHLLASQEFRVYPLLVTCMQDDTFVAVPG
jgi:hypothetical protein